MTLCCTISKVLPTVYETAYETTNDLEDSIQWNSIVDSAACA